MITDLQRILFGSSQASNIASTPASFNSFSSALVSGSSANPQLGSILASAPVANSPLSPVLYGTRYLSAGLSSGVTYTRSERFRISVGVNGARSQPLSQPSIAGVTKAALQRSMNLSYHLTTAYGLTPRLTLTGNWDTQQALRYQLSNAAYPGNFLHNSSASLGYLAGSNWVFTVGGGVGFVPSNGAAGVSGRPTQNTGRFTYIATGSVAYKVYSHTLVATGSRFVTNSYGLGGTVSINSNLGWHWNRPGSGWRVTADAGYTNVSGQQTISNALAGWRGRAGLSRMLTRHLAVLTDYSILRSTGTLSTANYNLTRSAAQVMLTYSFSDLMGSH
jgi:hypothetical protein